MLLSPDSVLESELFGHEKGAFRGAAQRRVGRFEQANGGTLFLDEVSEIPKAVQVKLLRFLQERTIEGVGGNTSVSLDVRIIAATNKDLPSLVESGEFRQDLYYRLNVMNLTIPPLRARPSDIVALARHFAHRTAAEEELQFQRFTKEAEQRMLAYPWPGNVRELQNAIEQAVIFCKEGVVDGAALPLVVKPKELLPLITPGMTLAEIERFVVSQTLASVGGNTAEAAQVLGMSRRTLQHRLKSLNEGTLVSEDD